MNFDQTFDVLTLPIMVLYWIEHGFSQAKKIGYAVGIEELLV